LSLDATNRAVQLESRPKFCQVLRQRQETVLRIPPLFLFMMIGEARRGEAKRASKTMAGNKPALRTEQQQNFIAYARFKRPVAQWPRFPWQSLRETRVNQHVIGEGNGLSESSIFLCLFHCLCRSLICMSQLATALNLELIGHPLTGNSREMRQEMKLKEDLKSLNIQEPAPLARPE
jgi:hypothetical protein